MSNPLSRLVHELLRVLDFHAGRRLLGMADVVLTEQGFTAKMRGDGRLWYDVTVTMTAVPCDEPESLEFWRPEADDTPPEPEVEHVAVDYLPEGRKGDPIQICQGCSSRRGGKPVAVSMCPVLGVTEE